MTRDGRTIPADQHVRFLSGLHWVWAGFNVVTGVAMGAFAVAAALLAGEGASEGLAASVTAGGFLLVAVTALVWAGLHAWCGGALARYDRWGRMLALALALFNLLLFPFGTLLAGYTLWVLLRDPARQRFESGRG